MGKELSKVLLDTLESMYPSPPTHLDPINTIYPGDGSTVVYVDSNVTPPDQSWRLPPPKPPEKPKSYLNDARFFSEHYSSPNP